MAGGLATESTTCQSLPSESPPHPSGLWNHPFENSDEAGHNSVPLALKRLFDMKFQLEASGK